MTARLMMALLLLATAIPSQGQVYRCAQDTGGTVYQSQPCPDGSAPIDAPPVSITPAQDAPAPQERTQADVDASRERQQRIQEAEARVQQIRRDNADPAQCSRARQELASLEARGANMQGVDAFEVRTRVMLYCEDL